MGRAWRLLTVRGRTLLVLGLLAVVVSILAGQHDVARLSVLAVLLPVISALLVARTRLRMSCERAIDPGQVVLGQSMTGRIRLGQEGRLPIGILMLEDEVPRELGSRPRFLVDRPGARWRREIEYPLRGRVRGRFHTGPLTVRTTDPFGLVQLDRQFSATSEVLVTPEIVPLPAMRTSGGAGSTGESRPHRIGVVGSDDALIREYRHGDDLRRIHWKSTARRNEVMVRREEQSWDPSARIVLDSRLRAHRGPGMRSSLEWAVSAAGSIAAHFLDDGFGVEIYDAEGPMHLTGTMGQHSSATRELMINRLTDLRASQSWSLHYALESAAAEHGGQLLVAVLGAIGVHEAEALVRARRHGTQGLALVLAVETFAVGDEAPVAGKVEQHEIETAIEMLRANQWRVVEVTRGTTVAEAWSTLEQVGVAA